MVIESLLNPVLHTQAGSLVSKRQLGRGFSAVRTHGSPVTSQYSFSAHLFAVRVCLSVLVCSSAHIIVPKRYKKTENIKHKSKKK